MKGALAATQSPLPVPASNSSPASQHHLRGGAQGGVKSHRGPPLPVRKQKSAAAARHMPAVGASGGTKRGSSSEARQEAGAGRPKGARIVSSIEQRAIALKRQKLEPESNFELPEVTRSSSRRRGAAGGAPLGPFPAGPSERLRGVPLEVPEAAPDPHPSTPRPGALAGANGVGRIPGGLFLDSTEKQPPRRSKR